jgi:hemerythrin-like domain-containing protein
MVEEHRNIKRMLTVIENTAIKVLKNEARNYEDFFAFIDFVRNYADKHHHGKEEIVLFDKIDDGAGTVAEKLVKHGIAGGA